MAKSGKTDSNQKQAKNLDTVEVVKSKNDQASRCECDNCGRTATASWLVLLFCGLALMFFEQMQPVLQYKFSSIPVSVVVGAVAVVMALNFLFRE